MHQILHKRLLIMTLMFSSASLLASPAVDGMSDSEVSEYAEQMSSVLDNIRNRRLCLSVDVRCISAEFARHGISYTDKVPVTKRLSIMVGSMH